MPVPNESVIGALDQRLTSEIGRRVGKPLLRVGEVEIVGKVKGRRGEHLVQHGDKCGIVLLDALIACFRGRDRDDLGFFHLENALLWKVSDFLRSFDDDKVIARFELVMKRTR